MKTCENCGERVYSLGCVNCNEADYIEVAFAEELAELHAEEDEARAALTAPADPTGGQG